MWLGACRPSDDSPFSRDGFRPAYLASSPATSYPLSMAQILNCIRTGLEPLLMSWKARAVKDEGLTYLSASKFRSIPAALRDVQCVTGDFVESGVAIGGSAIVIAHQATGRRDRTRVVRGRS